MGEKKFSGPAGGNFQLPLERTPQAHFSTLENRTFLSGFDIIEKIKAY
jgi:hypothetical protein